MLGEPRANHNELDISNLEVRYRETNQRVLLNLVDLRRAISEGLSFTASLANPEVVPSRHVVMTLVIVGANMTLAGSSGVFSKNPHAKIVQKVVPIQDGNPATITIDLLHDNRFTIIWHEGGGPYEVTLSAAPVGDSRNAIEGTGINLDNPFDIDTHTTHIDYHFVGVE
jgi:hypothetical protein